MVVSLGVAVFSFCKAIHLSGGMPDFGFQMGTLGEWAAAFFTFVAAAAALRIAKRDRRDRMQERRDEQSTHARLVQLSVRSTSAGSIDISVRNYGPLPVLDVDLVESTWVEHLDAQQRDSAGRWIRPSDEISRRHRPILMPHPAEFDDVYNTVAEFSVAYLHPTQEEILAPIEKRTAHFQYPNRVPIDPSAIRARVRFTTADGVRWELSTDKSGSGDPVRV